MAGGTAVDQASLGEKVFWIVAYSACSSSMLVINKLAVQSLPLPTVVSGAQLAVSAAVVVLMQAMGQNVMGPMDKTKVLPFTLYTAMFAGGLFANMKALMLTNVGAVIAARSCLPVVVCLIEWAFMGRSLPSARSVMSLGGVVGRVMGDGGRAHHLGGGTRHACHACHACTHARTHTQNTRGMRTCRPVPGGEGRFTLVSGDTDKY